MRRGQYKTMVAPEEWDYLLFGVKTCSVCGRRLPSCCDFFAPSRQHHDGLVTQCRDCRNERGRKRR